MEGWPRTITVWCQVYLKWVMILVTSAVIMHGIYWDSALIYDTVTSPRPANIVQRLRKEYASMVTYPAIPDEFLRNSATNRSSGCGIPTFRNTSGKITHAIRCYREEPTEHSCRVADGYFKGEEPRRCKYEYKELCTLNFEDEGQYLYCHQSACPSGVVILGTFATDTGNLVWSPFATMKELEDEFQHRVETGHSSVEDGMAFLKCINSTYEAWVKDEQEEPDEDDVLVQQLLIFPIITKSPTGSPNIHDTEDRELNINILFLDSISHSHFFRTLPLSVAQLQRMDQEGKSGHYDIFNFDRMQALKGRTFQSLHVLFSGQFSEIQKTIPAQDTLAALQNKGYDVIWNEDMCWREVFGVSKYWGFRKEKSGKRWKALKEAMSSYGVDDFGVSKATCEILEANDERAPFFTSRSICYNGRNHHWYIMEYVKQMQSVYQRAGVPYFLYTELNTAHENSAVRIKTFDENLVSYLKFLETLDNTLTFVLADHGNTYSYFAVNDDEGELERFNPFMFILAPRNFEKIVGRSGVMNLGYNQDKFISYLDVHLMLRHLINSSAIPTDPRLSEYDTEPRGLLDAVSIYRNCSSLPLFEDTKCICKSEEKTTNNTGTSGQLLLANFGLSYLNDIMNIQGQSEPTKNKAGVYGYCQNLSGIAINRVKETPGEGNETILEMNIVVEPGHPFSLEKPDIFTATFSISRASNTFTVTSWERRSIYGRYRSCADGRIDRELCICDVTPANTSSLSSTDSIPAENPFREVLANITETSRKVSECLTILERRRRTGMELTGVNTCSEDTVEFMVEGDKTNVMSSSKLPALYSIPGKRTKLLLAFLVRDESDDWSVGYSVSITSEDSLKVRHSQYT